VLIFTVSPYSNASLTLATCRWSANSLFTFL